MICDIETSLAVELLGQTATNNFVVAGLWSLFQSKVYMFPVHNLAFDGLEFVGFLQMYLHGIAILSIMGTLGENLIILTI